MNLTQHIEDGFSQAENTIEDALGELTESSTIRTMALALCYSIAEYAAPVWLRSTHVDNRYLLAGIAPPDIRRDVHDRMERIKQMEQETHSLFGHIPGRSA